MPIRAAEDLKINEVCSCPLLWRMPRVLQTQCETRGKALAVPYFFRTLLGHSFISNIIEEVTTQTLRWRQITPTTHDALSICSGPHLPLKSRSTPGSRHLQQCWAVHCDKRAPTMSLRNVALLQLCIRVAVMAAAKPQMHLRHLPVANAAAESRSKDHQAPSEDQAGCSKGFAFRSEKSIAGCYLFH